MLICGRPLSSVARARALGNRCAHNKPTPQPSPPPDPEKEEEEEDEDDDEEGQEEGEGSGRNAAPPPAKMPGFKVSQGDHLHRQTRR